MSVYRKETRKKADQENLRVLRELKAEQELVYEESLLADIEKEQTKEGNLVHILEVVNLWLVFYHSSQLSL